MSRNMMIKKQSGHLYDQEYMTNKIYHKNTEIEYFFSRSDGLGKLLNVEDI